MHLKSSALTADLCMRIHDLKHDLNVFQTELSINHSEINNTQNKRLMMLQTESELTGIQTVLENMGYNWNDVLIEVQKRYDDWKGKNMTERTLRKRIEVLKAMHLIMTNMNDEGAYYDWIVEGVPDCPSEEDFESIAEDTESFDECVNWFESVLHTYIKGGVYCGK